MANKLNLTESALDKYIGKSIEEICPLKYGTVGDKAHHCAHFVGHALTLNHSTNVGLTCAGMIWEGRNRKDEGACLRVNEVYNHVDHLDTADQKGCLIYITMKSNVKENDAGYTMGSQGKKHIGICLNGKVWHYGNTKDKVKRQTVAEFGKHYSGDTIVLYTRFPKSAKFVRVGERLVFDGSSLKWMRDGKPYKSWPAVSGRQGHQSKRHQSLEDAGPLPEGIWDVRQSEYQKMPQRSWIQKVAAELGRTAWPGGESAWGRNRIWLHPKSVPTMYGRSGFSIHGGNTPGSAGCIDLTSSMPEFVAEFLRHGRDIELEVKYS